MFTWKQESAALRILISYPKPSDRVKALVEETRLSEHQAKSLLDALAAKRGERDTRTRTFYAMAFSIGQDMAGITMGMQAFVAAGVVWFGLFLLYDGRPFLGMVSFGLVIALLVSLYSAYSRYQAFEAQDGVVVEGRIEPASRESKRNERKAA